MQAMVGQQANTYRQSSSGTGGMVSQRTHNFRTNNFINLENRRNSHGQPVHTQMANGHLIAQEQPAATVSAQMNATDSTARAHHDRMAALHQSQ